MELFCHFGCWLFALHNLLVGADVHLRIEHLVEQVDDHGLQIAAVGELSHHAIHGRAAFGDNIVAAHARLQGRELAHPVFGQGAGHAAHHEFGRFETHFAEAQFVDCCNRFFQVFQKLLYDLPVVERQGHVQALGVLLAVHVVTTNAHFVANRIDVVVVGAQGEDDAVGVADDFNAINRLDTGFKALPNAFGFARNFLVAFLAEVLHDGPGCGNGAAGAGAPLPTARRKCRPAIRCTQRIGVF